MIRSLFLILLLCASVRAQVQSPTVVTNTAQLAALRVGGLKAAIMVATNGNVEFAYSASATDATNTSITSPIIKPLSDNGRWFGKKVGASTTSIYATDPAYGAIGDYTGTQNTAGTGTDNRAAIQAALNAAYTQGPGGFNDTVNGVSYRVVIPKGKYYISAPAAGTPSLTVPLKCELDFSEAELHFDRPPLTHFTNTVPNPLWCAIKVGPMASLTIGKMQMKPDQDQTYSGTWYGMSLDAIRIQESDLSWIRGGGREHYILGFRGAGIRRLACLNTFVKDINFSANCFGIVDSYFGSAFDGSVTGTGYTRYRGVTTNESICVALWVNHCSFLNIYKKAIFTGVDGDYHAPAAGGFETITTSKVGGGPISITQCPFENIAEEVLFSEATGGVFMSDIRIERSGAINTLGTITAALCNSFNIERVTWQEEGGTCYQASYTGPLSLITPNPGAFVRVNATDVSPSLANIYINNTASVACQLVKGDVNVTRLPTAFNYRAGTSLQMQGTDAYMQNMIIENDGGRIWSVSTVGLPAQEAVNGSRTNFTFLNGFTRQKPQRLRIDGATYDGTNSVGSVKWTWDGTAKTVTTTAAPTADLRAFF